VFFYCHFPDLWSTVVLIYTTGMTLLEMERSGQSHFPAALGPVEKAPCIHWLPSRQHSFGWKSQVFNPSPCFSPTKICITYQFFNSMHYVVSQASWQHLVGRMWPEAYYSKRTDLECDHWRTFLTIPHRKWI